MIESMSLIITNILAIKILFLIIASTFFSTILAVILAFFIQTTLLAKFVTPMVSLSVGFILGLCFLHGLPEAFTQVPTQHIPYLFITFLGGILSFFLLEKGRIFRHNHHYEGDGHNHEHGFDKKAAGKGGISILVGDSLHNFVDGLMVAAAFLHSPSMGFLTAFAIFAHEIPQEVGDFLILLNAGFTQKRALLFNLCSGLACVFGGIVGYYGLQNFLPYIPYILVFAYSSLVYIAMSDLLPQMQYHSSKKEYVLQIVFIMLGLVLIYMFTHNAHV
jgi:zinc and cadmium transporter